VLAVSPGSAGGSTWWGTLEFVAPEVANHGAVAYSPASDWWGLGVLIYNLLLGLTPWDGEGYDETLRQIQTGDVLWPPEGMVSGVNCLSKRCCCGIAAAATAATAAAAAAGICDMGVGALHVDGFSDAA
jgi:hypothetical protein